MSSTSSPCDRTFTPYVSVNGPPVTYFSLHSPTEFIQWIAPIRNSSGSRGSSSSTESNDTLASTLVSGHMKLFHIGLVGILSACRQQQKILCCAVWAVNFYSSSESILSCVCVCVSHWVCILQYKQNKMKIHWVRFIDAQQFLVCFCVVGCLTRENIKYKHDPPSHTIRTQTQTKLRKAKERKFTLIFLNCYESFCCSLNHFERNFFKASKKAEKGTNIQIQSSHCNQIECRTIHWTIKNLVLRLFSFWYCFSIGLKETPSLSE